MSDPTDWIRRKRDGQSLSESEIRDFVCRITEDRVPDYQAAALLMAIFLRGLDAQELATLTDAMIHSGQVLDFSDIAKPKVDKHSTGGVGDKISLALAPAVAACGVAVPMISGRGLGHTGGTLDKLETIPGFRTDLDPARFRTVLETCGLVLAGQSASLAPADRKLYALRDATSTVESIPLIAASIMSKKLAEGIDGLVLDVKVGRGAFMKDLAQARLLGQTLVQIGQRAGCRVSALLTDMEQPIGRAVGNLCELVEAVETLRGGGPSDTRALTLALGGEMLVLARVAPDRAAGERRIAEAIGSGEALRCFRRVVAAQGGDPEFLERPPRYAPAAQEVHAQTAGFVSTIDAEAVGRVVMAAGAGRVRKEDSIDGSIALFLERKVGEPVTAGDVLAILHTKREDPAAVRALAAAFTIGPTAPPSRPLLHETLT